jgi:hypothetical protein
LVVSSCIERNPITGKTKSVVIKFSNEKPGMSSIVVTIFLSP